MRRLIRQADRMHAAKALVLSVNEASDQLIEVYTKLYEALNRMYEEFPEIYGEIQRTVKLPTNDDAKRVAQFNADLKDELAYIDNDAFLADLLGENTELTVMNTDDDKVD